MIKQKSTCRPDNTRYRSPGRHTYLRPESAWAYYVQLKFPYLPQRPWKALGQELAQAWALAQAHPSSGIIIMGAGAGASIGGITMGAGTGAEGSISGVIVGADAGTTIEGILGPAAGLGYQPRGMRHSCKHLCAKEQGYRNMQSRLHTLLSIKSSILYLTVG